MFLDFLKIYSENRILKSLISNLGLSNYIKPNLVKQIFIIVAYLNFSD